MTRRVTVDRLGEAVRAAYVEGYVQGALHPHDAQVLERANRLADLFWGVVEVGVADRRSTPPTPEAP